MPPTESSVLGMWKFAPSQEPSLGVIALPYLEYYSLPYFSLWLSGGLQGFQGGI